MTWNNTVVQWQLVALGLALGLGIGCGSSDADPTPGPVSDVPDDVGEPPPDVQTVDSVDVVEPPDIPETPDVPLVDVADVVDAVADVGPDTTTPLAGFGELCETNEDCASGICVDIIGRPFCSAPCTEDAQCQRQEGFQWSCVGLGLPAGNVCTPTCNDGAACAEGQLCVLAIQTYTGFVDLCFDLSDVACASQADCEDGTYCTITGGGRDFMAICSDQAPGEVLVGEPCPAEADPNIPCDAFTECPENQTCNLQYGVCNLKPEFMCAAWICWPQGTCASPCGVDEDCPSDHRCLVYQLQVSMGTEDPSDDALAPLGLCTPFEGSAAPCASDAACPEGEHCTFFRDQDGVPTVACRKADEGAVGVGESCDDDPLTVDVLEAPVPCESNICTYGGVCTELCESVADCGPADAWQCVDSEVAPGVEVGLCTKGAVCETNADCPVEGESCTVWNDDEGFAGRCLQTVGELPGGASCDNTAAYVANVSCVDSTACEDVIAGWLCDVSDHHCVPPPATRCTLGWCPSSGYCGELCTADADCPTADFVCSGLGFVYDQSGTFDPSDDLVAIAPVCTYFPGSRSDCTSDADCTADGEACHLQMLLDGTRVQRCAATHPEGVEAGAACGLVSEEVVFCRSDMCDFNDGQELEGQGTCMGLCAATEDCPEGLECLELALPPLGTDVVTACRRPEAQ